MQGVYHQFALLLAVAAAVGFVNAGLLNLSQALWVLCSAPMSAPR